MNDMVKNQEQLLEMAHEVQKHQDMIKTLKESLYPGARDESVEMVLAYCRAKKYDPLKKPVHIVPMYVRDAKTGQGSMKDVVMPGIVTYRIDAQRSGNYAGVDEPIFGPQKEMKGVVYPEWCKVTVKALLPNGSIAEFVAKEYWLENYATKGKDSREPNTMWAKRPYGQLAKCAEAQALRKAFPDILGGEYIAEEMEGKVLPPLEKKNTYIEAKVMTENEALVELYKDHPDGCLEDFLNDIELAETLDELKLVNDAFNKDKKEKLYTKEEINTYAERIKAKKEFLESGNEDNKI